MALIDSSQIHPANVIDGTWETCLSIADLIAQQYFGSFIYAKTPPDVWLLIGLAGHLVQLFNAKEFGRNERKYQLYEAAKDLYRSDAHVQPLYCTDYIHPSELYSPLMYKKAPLVIHMIDKLIQSTNMRKLMNTLVNNALEKVCQYFHKF
jgi:aminopeptidase N